MAMPLINKSRNRTYNPYVYKKIKVVHSVKTQPEFKPGDTPHLQYGNEVLNENVEWAQLINDILKCGYTVQAIADYVKSDIDVIEAILAQDYSSLDFRTGAWISTLHCHCQHRSKRVNSNAKTVL